MMRQVYAATYSDYDDFDIIATFELEADADAFVEDTSNNANAVEAVPFYAAGETPTYVDVWHATETPTGLRDYRSRVLDHVDIDTTAKSGPHWATAASTDREAARKAAQEAYDARPQD